MGKSYTVKYFSHQLGPDNKPLFLDPEKTEYTGYTGMSIKEILRSYISFNNYQLAPGQRFYIHEQINPSRWFIIEIVKPLKLEPIREDNIIKGFAGDFDYWNFSFKGYYKKIQEAL